MKFKILICCSLLTWYANSAGAQVSKLPPERQRLLLQLTSGFYNVISLGQINLDSSLIATSTSLSLGRQPVILEGFENEWQGSDLTWIDRRHPSEAIKQLKGLKKLPYAKQLLLIGAYYSFQSGKINADADSALVYLLRSRKECVALHNNFWINQADILIAKSYLKKFDTQKAAIYTNQVLRSAHKLKDLRTEVKARFYYAAYCPFIPDTLALRITRMDQSARLFHQLKNYPGEIISRTYYAYLNFAAGDVPRARTAAQRTLFLQDSIKFPYTQFNQDQLAYISAQTGDHITLLSRGCLKWKQPKEPV
jgi:hypothetical protein